MDKTCFFLLGLSTSVAVQASSPCDSIQGGQSHKPLRYGDGSICFVEQPVLDKNGKQIDIEAEAINIYFVRDSGDSSKIGELPYLAAKGAIESVFLLDLDNDNHKDIVIIHSVEIGGSVKEPGSSNDYYSVLVFRKTNGLFEFHERASSWYGSGYAWISYNGNIIDKFPYQNMNSIRQALTSPFASLMFANTTLRANVIRKSGLYEGPVLVDKTKQYLIAGDKVSVDAVTASWCSINYTGGKRPLQRWMKCDNLNVIE